MKIVQYNVNMQITLAEAIADSPDLIPEEVLVESGISKEAFIKWCDHRASEMQTESQEVTGLQIAHLVIELMSTGVANLVNGEEEA